MKNVNKLIKGVNTFFCFWFELDSVDLIRTLNTGSHGMLPGSECIFLVEIDTNSLKQ